MKEALFQMFPTKAPGPDGFPAHFFQRYWELCAAEVTAVVMRVLRGEDDPAAINNTLVVLIPKVASPEELGQFRPISLCNVIYKLASKVAANRLKQILSEIISEEQSAFVSGRLITDNIITAYECLHFMKKKRAKNLRCCALKLDMKKAYDRVEWSYLRAIMLRLGFHRVWVDMVMRLITSVSFSILFNGECTESFTPSRGIRQGDPISPYLFLLAAEGLSCLLKSRNESSNLSGIKVAPSAPVVSHLLFADDCLLFFRADRESAEEVKDVLGIYCRASGQQVNMEKSSIHFAKGCNQAIREEVMNIMDVHSEALSEKYLGMPSDVGTASMGAFKYLKDRVWKRVQGWMEMLLSAGGKEVLIKSVAQAIPTFSMSCFKLPRGLCEHINGLLRNFWWGSREGKRKTCWVAWEEMTKPKHLGGLGFRDIELFNLALLARQAWRMVQQPEALSARILKSVYFPNCDFLEAEAGSTPSRVWRAILEGKDVLKQGMIRRIGTGEQTSIWNANWLPRDGLLRPVCCVHDNPPQLVCELIDTNKRSWDMAKVQAFLAPMDVDVIRNIPLPSRQQEDHWAWHYDKRGIFSVRSAYKMLVNTRDSRTAWLESSDGRSDRKGEEKEWSELWHVRVPSKLRIFLWRLAKQSLPSADVLHHRHMAERSICMLCGKQDSWRHALIECNMASCVWALLPEGLVEAVINFQEADARSWLAAIIGFLSQEELTLTVVTLWAIWHARRKALYEDVFQSPLSTFSFITRFITELEFVKSPVQKDRGVTEAPGWLPPPIGVAKVNVDAAIAKNGSTAAVAAVARDATGTFLGASAMVTRGATDPEMLEASACREGMALAMDLNLRKVKLASDCANVIRTIRAGDKLGSYGQIIRELEETTLGFQAVEFAHEGRQSNVEAHGLARGSIYSDLGRLVWLLNPPEGVCMNFIE